MASKEIRAVALFSSFSSESRKFVSISCTARFSYEDLVSSVGKAKIYFGQTQIAG